MALTIAKMARSRRQDISVQISDARRPLSQLPPQYPGKLEPDPSLHRSIQAADLLRTLHLGACRWRSCLLRRRFCPCVWNLYREQIGTGIHGSGLSGFQASLDTRDKRGRLEESDVSERQAGLIRQPTDSDVASHDLVISQSIQERAAVWEFCMSVVGRRHKVGINKNGILQPSSGGAGTAISDTASPPRPSRIHF